MAMPKGRFDANFASRAYLIETVICYPFFCGGGVRNLSRPAASTQELKGSLRSRGAIRPIAMLC
jgi:hypothetical protein